MPTTREEDIQAFLDCETLEELQSLSVKVVKGEIRAPNYGFDEVEGNSDNHWWGKGPRWELLVKINEAGIITLNAEEGEEIPYQRIEGLPTKLTEKELDELGFTAGNASNWRCSLTCLVPRFYRYTVLNGLRSDGFMVVNNDIFVDDYDDLKIEYRVRLTSGVNWRGVDGKGGTSMPILSHNDKDRVLQSYNFALDSLIPYLNDEFAEQLLNVADEYTFVDLFYNRPAHHPDGLFSRILYHATKAEQEIQGVTPTIETTTLVQTPAMTPVAATAASPLPPPIAPKPVAKGKNSEMQKAQAKASKYWKQHPRGETKDMNHKARTVVTTSAKYVPAKNDFKGFDDGSRKVNWR